MQQRIEVQQVVEEEAIFGLDPVQGKFQRLELGAVHRLDEVTDVVDN